MKPRYLKFASEFREWLAANHARERELFVGFFKKDSGRRGIAYAEAVDEALCFGWIDGLKRRVDELSYTHRFTPRKPKSNWSLANLRHVERLIETGRMMPAGMAAYEARDPKRCGRYSFENQPRTLAAADERRFKGDKVAWDFFRRQPPGDRRIAIWWVVGAKKDETRRRRLGQLIESSHLGRRLAHLTSKK